jgi:hypothetical protein
MFKKYFLIKFSLFLLALFCVNLFLRKFTPFSYALLLNYNQLYYPQEKIYINRKPVGKIFGLNSIHRESLGFRYR